MDKTPKSARSCKREATLSSHSNFRDESSSSTGTYFNQDSISDVGWDWDSPKNIKPKAARKPPQNLNNSPKIPQKRRMIIDHDNFEKLRQEMQALRDEIAKVDESTICISPADEDNIDEEINLFIEQQYSLIEEQDREKQVHDLLNDDCDDELIACTQRLENIFEQEAVTQPVTKSDTTIDYSSFNDSFDALIDNIKDEDLNYLTQSALTGQVQKPTQSNVNSSFKRTTSDANVDYIPRKISVMNRTFQRNHSFDNPGIGTGADLPKQLLDEIERKRREALAKLQEKKKKIKCQSPTNIPGDIVPTFSCSPEEIEQKRLQAKAIRDAKIIEKNRQEAIRRLQMNRIKKK